MPLNATRSRYLLPGLTVLVAVAAMLFHGPMAQLTDYHHFADQRAWMGIANASDVLSNLGFALVGWWGLLSLRKTKATGQAGREGYGLFFIALLLTALGSAWYHLAPDNAHLVWDRLPVALAGAALLSAVWRDTLGAGRWVTLMLAAMAVASVAWWRFTDLHGVGDLRPYLLLQLLPLVLIPMVQWQQDSPRPQRMAFLWAMGLYVMAKVFELADHTVMDSLGLISGHTLKHLLATLAAGMVARSALTSSPTMVGAKSHGAPQGKALRLADAHL